MPLRRVVGIALAGLLVVGSAGTAIALSAGPSHRISLPYSSHRTFVSQEAGICVEATVRGTAVATRSGRAPLVRWTDVQLRDPSMIASGYRVTAGRCDHAHPIELASILKQSWSVGGDAAVTRRTDQGPALTLRQFNSGYPIDLADRGFPASVFGSGYPITGEMLIDAQFDGGGEGFGYRTAVTLR